MAYIGKQPLIGNFQVCDAISTVDGQAAYTLQVGGANVSPETANNMIVSVNGVIQKPNISYTVSGSTITFTSNLVTGDVIDFIQILGNVLDLGVPSDNTVSLAKLTATGTKDATTFLRGDNTFAEAGGGKVLQVVTATDTTNRTVSSSSFTSTTVSASITPSATANKILILVSGMMSVSTSQSYGYLTVYRNATDLASTTANGLTGNYYAGDSPVNQNAGAISVSFLDSPSSTSATSYTVYIRTNASAVKFGVTSTQTITLIEIEG